MRITGPVFAYEWASTARRWQVYALRSGVVLVLLVAMTLIWWSDPQASRATTIRAQAAVGQSYFYGLIGTQLVLMMLAAPAFTAGAICADRQKGVLTHMLVTDLSDSEIVLGKLAARLAPVAGLVACALPVLSLGTLLGGIDPVALSLAFLVSLAVGVTCCTLALAISVWAVKTQEVLMASYTLIICTLLHWWIWESIAGYTSAIPHPPIWLLHLNPFWLSFAPYSAPNQVWWGDFAIFFGAAAALSASLAGVAVARMRVVTIRLADGRPRRRGRVRDRLGFVGRAIRALPGPSLDHNPVLWREWHRSRPSRLSLILWTVFALVFSYGCAWGISEMITGGVGPSGPNVGLVFVMFEIMIGLLLLSVAAPTSLAEERARGSLDVLMASPLRTRTILAGKWWAAFRAVPLLAFWPAATMLALAFAKRQPLPAGWPTNFYYQVGFNERLYCAALVTCTILVHGALLTSLGLALAAWVKSQGRAVALCVFAYVIVCIGWPVFVLILLERGTTRDLGMGLAAASPLFGSVQVMEHVTLGYRQNAAVVIWTTCWDVLIAAAALGLWLATWATFDRRLGRISDWPDELGMLADRLSPRVESPWIDDEPEALGRKEPASGVTT